MLETEKRQRETLLERQVGANRLEINSSLWGALLPLVVVSL